MTYLCGVDTAFATDLNASAVPEALQKALNQDELFPSPPMVAVNEPDRQWTIVTGEKCFFIRKENGTLNAYLMIVKDNRQLLMWHHPVRGAIFGQVIEETTQRPIGGAQLWIESQASTFTDWLALKQLQHGTQWPRMCQRPDRTLSTREGHYHFVELPTSVSLTVCVVAQGFQPQNREVTLEHTGYKQLKDFVLQPIEE